MYRAYQTLGIVTSEDYQSLTTTQWFLLLRDVIALMPPGEFWSYFSEATQQRETVLTRMRQESINLQLRNGTHEGNPTQWIELWQELFDLARLYMAGATYADMAIQLLRLQPSQITGNRTTGTQPIPTVFSFLHRIIDRMSIDAGCFLALNEAIFPANDEVQNVPEALAILPICIRHGLDSAAALHWYRYGFANRVVAHALNRNLPIPVEIVRDEDRIQWVRSTKRRWIAGEFDGLERAPFLEHARTILRGTEN